MYSLVLKAENELALEHFSDAPELVKIFCTTGLMERYPMDTLNDFLELTVHRPRSQRSPLPRSRPPQMKGKQGLWPSPHPFRLCLFQTWKRPLIPRTPV